MEGEPAMVYVILTARGLKDLLRNLSVGPSLWINGGCADKDEIDKLRSGGWDITVWANWFDPVNGREIESALATVREHHPDSTIWIETVTNS
jgi:hypothetical protein